MQVTSDSSQRVAIHNCERALSITVVRADEEEMVAQEALEAWQAEAEKEQLPSEELTMEARPAPTVKMVLRENGAQTERPGIPHM